MVKKISVLITGALILGAGVLILLNIIMPRRIDRVAGKFTDTMVKRNILLVSGSPTREFKMVDDTIIKVFETDLRYFDNITSWDAVYLPDNFEKAAVCAISTEVFGKKIFMVSCGNIANATILGFSCDDPPLMRGNFVRFADEDKIRIMVYPRNGEHRD